jgi:hypothetical protein
MRCCNTCYWQWFLNKCEIVTALHTASSILSLDGCNSSLLNLQCLEYLHHKLSNSLCKIKSGQTYDSLELWCPNAKTSCHKAHQTNSKKLSKHSFLISKTQVVMCIGVRLNIILPFLHLVLSQYSPRILGTFWILLQLLKLLSGAKEATTHWHNKNPDKIAQDCHLHVFESLETMSQKIGSSPSH